MMPRAVRILLTTKQSQAGWAHVRTETVLMPSTTHMTNTMNTPVEAIETNYPMQVATYSIRRGTGGAGKFRGGDGVIRALRLLTDAGGYDSFRTPNARALWLARWRSRTTRV